MKKITTILALLAISTFTFGQTNAIKLNPLSLLGGTDLLSIEHAMNDNNTVGVGVGYGSFGIGDFKYTQVGAEGSFRHYPREALKGLYLGGLVGFTSGKVIEEKYTSLKAGIKIGNQWVFDSGFVIDLGGGINYRTFNYASDVTDDGYKTNGIGPSFNFSIGYAF